MSLSFRISPDTSSLIFTTVRVTFPKESSCFLLIWLKMGRASASYLWFFSDTKKGWLFCVFFTFSFCFLSMLRSQVQDLVIPRACLEKPRRSISLPLPLASLLDVNGFSRKSCSYSKLPEEPIKLSVRKLDGSSFDVQVIKSATVAELKLAVQRVFSHMPKEGPGKISWPHVWGHFCLCYHALKLLTDTDHIINYGIQDGVQLHFVRHVSSSYNLTKIQSKKTMVTQKQSYLSMRSSTGTLASELNGEEDDNDDNIDNDEGRYKNKKQSMIVQQECQFGHLWRGWSSCSRRKGPSKGRVCQRRDTPSFVGNCRKLFQLWGTAKYSPKRK